MNLLVKSKIVLLGLCICSASTLYATPAIDQRQDNQKDRIKQGVSSGELTRGETRRLVKGQKELRRMGRRAEADGVVTKREKVRLQHKANKESARIYRQKHDAQDRI